MTNTLPTTSFKGVCHIGSLDRAAQNPHAGLEGRSLSVSRHPRTWGRIARIGTGPCWSLRRSDGQDLTFLDALAVKGDKDLRTLVEQWGLEQGLVEHRTLWSSHWHDSELDEEIGFLHLSEEEALDEIAYRDEEDGYITALPDAIVMTPALGDRMGWTNLDNQLPLTFDGLLMAWAEETTDLDGVWWFETLDPAIYSAPRGCIFNGRMDRMKPTLKWQ